jgi:hypothetical protein
MGKIFLKWVTKEYWDCKECWVRNSLKYSCNGNDNRIFIKTKSCDIATQGGAKPGIYIQIFPTPTEAAQLEARYSKRGQSC